MRGNGRVQELCLLALLVPASMAHAQQASCTCDDLPDLARMDEETRVVIKTLAAQLTALLSSSNPDQQFTNEGWRQELQYLQNAINAGDYSGLLPLSPGDIWTDVNCQLHDTHDPPLSPCLKAAFEAHEQAHIEPCRTWRDDVVNHYFRVWANWQGDQKLRDAMREDLEGYSREQAFAEQQIRKLECSCALYSARFEAQRQPMQPAPLVKVDYFVKPVEIPLDVSQDGTWSGGASTTGGSAGKIGLCAESSNDLDDLRVTGTVTGRPTRLPRADLTLDATLLQITPYPVQCPPPAVRPKIAQTPGHSVSLDFEMSAYVGAKTSVPITSLGDPPSGSVTATLGIRKKASASDKWRAFETYLEATQSPLPVCPPGDGP